MMVKTPVNLTPPIPKGYKIKKKKSLLSKAILMFFKLFLNRKISVL